MGNGAPTDRAAAVRLALRSLVAERGFHGASMSAVAARAGVAAGTAYVHYRSKDELVLATYDEIKQELGEAATAGLDPTGSPSARFGFIGRAVYNHLAAEPERARFLVQADVSPFAEQTHQEESVVLNPLLVEAAKPDMAVLLRPLPEAVLFDLGFGPLIRAAGREQVLQGSELEELVKACWQAITV